MNRNRKKHTRAKKIVRGIVALIIWLAVVWLANLGDNISL